MKDDIIKVVAYKPFAVDETQVFALRYRRAIVGYVGGGEITEYVNECLTLDDGVPTWHAYPSGGIPQPFVRISGLLQHMAHEADADFLETLKTWVDTTELEVST